MATNISVYDLLSYPDNAKTITIDLKKITPHGAGGDEKWILSSVTSATASGSASIQDTFVDDTVVGWSKSSGIPSGPFTIDASHLTMLVAVDEAVGGAASIDLSVSAAPVTGDEVASDIQTQIGALSTTGAAKEGNLSYLNAKCYYEDGRFIITSGSLGTGFTGVNRSSVSVAAGVTNDVTATLGFDIPLESDTLAGQTITETYCTSSVTSTTIPVNSVSSFSSGDCVVFKDASGNNLYRYLDSVSDPNLVVNTSVAVTENDLVQILRVQDPEGKPSSYYTDIDSALRHAIDNLIQQIDFSS